jgi:hypothetical protein
MHEGKQCRIFYQEQDRILATEKDPGQVLEVAGVKLCVFNVEMAVEKINWLLFSVFSAGKRFYSFFSFFLFSVLVLRFCFSLKRPVKPCHVVF